ncbi:hypothetical protein Q2T42_00745 [Leptolyngbya boryana CZ1]|uniref:Uncharacterized protein n=1 Tax=Leptolyngbya boryana CZ1 TaxID=3060204 RepID=A0AA96WY92_LEPBY|nr:hypothetical protein [Leptolyngbya boryana]WNZ46364.1 hypothetical protein Q2T42_00745 [Leptolyngbya boryana CZ1]
MSRDRDQEAKSIEEDLDFSYPVYKLLANLETARTVLKDISKALRKQLEQILMAVALKYGKDSQYCYLIGRVRTSDLKM